MPHSCKLYEEKWTALPFGLRGSSVSLRFSLFSRSPTETMEFRIYSFSSFTHNEFAASTGHAHLQGVTISACQQPPVPPMSPVAGGFWLRWTRGGLTGTQAEKSHGEIPFPGDFYAGEHSALLGSIGSCCLCQEFTVSVGAWG